MDINKEFLSFVINRHDHSSIDASVIASNGRFAGCANFYTDADAQGLIDFARSLQGFPKRIDQVEEYWFGISYSNSISLRKTDQDPSTFDSFAGLKFLCIDGFGHTAVDLTLYQEKEYWSGRPESRGEVFFELEFLPAQLDEFVKELFALAENKEGSATLLASDYSYRI